MSFHSYIALKGKTQGTVKGGSQKAGRQGRWSDLIDFRIGPHVAFFGDSGRPNAAFAGQPVVITKETDDASPQLLNAHWNTETFEEVVIEIAGPSGGGETLYGRITLTNATISGYRQYAPTVRGGHLGQGGGAGRPLTDFIFEYEKIDFRPW